MSEFYGFGDYPVLRTFTDYEKILYSLLKHGERQVYSVIYNELMFYKKEHNLKTHMTLDELLETKDKAIREMVSSYVVHRKLNKIPNQWFAVFEDLHYHLGISHLHAHIFDNNNLQVIVQHMAKALAAAEAVNNDPDTNPIIAKILYDRRWSAFANGLKEPVAAYKPAAILHIVQWFISNPYLMKDRISVYKELRDSCQGRTMRAIRQEINNA